MTNCQEKFLTKFFLINQALIRVYWALFKRILLTSSFILDWCFFISGAGPRNDTCTADYRGPSAFSENCTKNVEKFALKIQSNLMMYIDIHSYSQFILLPYSYTSGKRPQNDKEIVSEKNLHVRHVYICWMKKGDTHIQFPW